MAPTITVGGSSSTGAGTTFGDLIEKVYRRVMGGVRERTVQITNAVGANSGIDTIVLNGAQIAGVQPGVILAVELELMYVLSWSAGNSTATVERGYYGSIATTHNAGTIAYMNPRYSRYDIGVAINDDLRSLSSPTNGLFRVGVATLTYNPVFQGYDLGDLPDNFIDIIEIRYRIAPPYRTFPAIKKWKILRGVPDPVFPSGKGLIIYEAGWPGLPIYVQYSAPFIRMVNTSDDLFNTPATNDDSPPYNGYSTTATINFTGTTVNGSTLVSVNSTSGLYFGMPITDVNHAVPNSTTIVGIDPINSQITLSQAATGSYTAEAMYAANPVTVQNLPRTAVDLPPLGAEIDLTLPREISRNFMESQPDPRKGVEVPAGSVSGSVNALMARRMSRINEEADRLQRQYTKVRSW